MNVYTLYEYTIPGSKYTYTYTVNIYIRYVYGVADSQMNNAFFS